MGEHDCRGTECAKCYRELLEGERFANESLRTRLAQAEAVSEGRLKVLNEKAEELRREWSRAEAAESRLAEPLPLVLYCPAGHQHIDEGEWATKPHKTHRCTFHEWADSDMPEQDGIGFIQVFKACGLEWRPANFPTVGIPALAAPSTQEEPK